MFENRLLRRILEPKKDEVAGGCRKLHNLELRDLYSLPRMIKYDQVKEDEMGKACSTNGERRNVYRLLVGKTERKKPLVKPTFNCIYNIMMDLGEVGWGAWTGLVWLRIGAGGDLS
jgi:hypothetical protein